jgi:hypothetical protein
LQLQCPRAQQHAFLPADLHYDDIVGRQPLRDERTINAEINGLGSDGMFAAFGTIIMTDQDR